MQAISGATVLANTLTGLGIDEFFTRTDAAGTRALLTDALGSILALTDPAGTVQTEYTYEPFGATTATGALSANPFQYTGRENDGTGLYFYRARYYHPQLQRFISEDPINSMIIGLSRQMGIALPALPGDDPVLDPATVTKLIGNGLSSTLPLANAFPYANNAPTRFVDPLGLWYIDFNISVGFVGGVTGGILISPSGTYPYLGGGIVIGPGPVSGSVTYSPFDPTTGWSVALQAHAGIAGQIGYSAGSNGGFFGEEGIGWPPGGSFTGYYVWGPFLPRPPAGPGGLAGRK